MKLNPYLLLDGTAAEALAFYADVFDAAGSLDIMKYGEMPEDMGGVPEGAENLVANGNIKVGENEIHMSDRVAQWHGDYTGISGNTIQISLEDVDAAQKYFDALSVGGTVTMAPAQTFWSPLFGTLTDKFGVEWMVNVTHS